MKEGFTNNGIKISARQTKLIIERLKKYMNSETPLEIGESQSPLKEAARLNLLEVQKVIGVNSSPNNQDLRSDLIEFLKFARSSGGFKIW